MERTLSIFIIATTYTVTYEPYLYMRVIDVAIPELPSLEFSILKTNLAIKRRAKRLKNALVAV